MTRGGDAEKLDKIQLFLQKRQLVPNREIPLPDNGKGWEIDMRIKFPKGFADLQLDAYKTHGCIDMEQNKHTRERNAVMTKNGLEWRIIDEELCNLLNIPYEAMAFYLALEMKMHLIAKHEAQI